MGPMPQVGMPHAAMMGAGPMNMPHPGHPGGVPVPGPVGMPMPGMPMPVIFIELFPH